MRNNRRIFNPRNADGLFDQFINDIFTNLMRDSDPYKGNVFTPFSTNNWRVRVKDNNLIVCGMVPGFDENSIKISLVNNTLHITGEREIIENELFEGMKNIDFKYTLPFDTTNISNVKATCRNGVLVITIPMTTPESKAVNIPINKG